ncbi:hypothetical protein WOLCODRAFT_149099 [Wolfiporia cocos MD-104 SS10]|uniref:Uncharacterized protein n=1 Tax=Wolfiporia cocos (strain MD-104) TaxID=742152 RepID=A0A2H3JHA7_WOLCO|nr:hypothetical protein WOLCODRAFT_149099 [Wolfiporia cocos MD-104 SS10]
MDDELSKRRLGSVGDSQQMRDKRASMRRDEQLPARPIAGRAVAERVCTGRQPRWTRSSSLSPIVWVPLRSQWSGCTGGARAQSPASVPCPSLAPISSLSQCITRSQPLHLPRGHNLRVTWPFGASPHVRGRIIRPAGPTHPVAIFAAARGPTATPRVL